MGRIFTLLLPLVLLSSARADTLVLFVPSPDELHREVYGTFYHTAIRVDGQWWEAHPYYGVHKNPALGKLQSAPGVRVLRSSINIPLRRVRELESLKGVPFDLHSEWNDVQSFNCTELVAYALEAHHYAIPITEKGFRIGELGLSPDRLYKLLLAEGWKLESTASTVCHDFLVW